MNNFPKYCFRLRAVVDPGCKKCSTPTSAEAVVTVAHLKHLLHDEGRFYPESILRIKYISHPCADLKDKTKGSQIQPVAKSPFVISQRFSVWNSERVEVTPTFTNFEDCFLGAMFVLNKLNVAISEHSLNECYSDPLVRLVQSLFKCDICQVYLTREGWHMNQLGVFTVENQPESEV